MEKYLKYDEVMNIVLHHEGQAAVAAVQDLKPIKAIPIEFIEEEIQSYCRKYGDVRGYAGTFVEVSIETLKKLLRDYGEESNVSTPLVYFTAARSMGKSYAALRAIQEMMEGEDD